MRISSYTGIGVPDRGAFGLKLVAKFGGGSGAWRQGNRFEEPRESTVTFQLLYCFFFIVHGCRKIRHFNVTRHPTADCLVRQLCEASPEALPYRYVILDRYSRFDADVAKFPAATGSKLNRINPTALWQSGIRRSPPLHVVSHEEGLDQTFNSLDAKREAGGLSVRRQATIQVIRDPRWGIQAFLLGRSRLAL